MRWIATDILWGFVICSLFISCRTETCSTKRKLPFLSWQSGIIENVSNWRAISNYTFFHTCCCLWPDFLDSVPIALIFDGHP